MPRTPEAQARQEIDRLLEAAGWHVCDAKAVNIHAARGVAIREFELTAGHGTADYLLYVDGKAAGVIEARNQVLEYFDASLIGLAATPNKQTFGFFDQNRVMEYDHEKAVVDGVNVDFDAYRTAGPEPEKPIEAFGTSYYLCIAVTDIRTT